MILMGKRFKHRETNNNRALPSDSRARFSKVIGCTHKHIGKAQKVSKTITHIPTHDTICKKIMDHGIHMLRFFFARKEKMGLLKK